MLIIKSTKLFKVKILGGSPIERLLWEFIFAIVLDSEGYEVVFVQSNYFAPEEEFF